MIKIGHTYYVALIEDVLTVKVLEKGDGGYNLKRRFANPYLVKILKGKYDVGSDLVVAARDLHSDFFAAAMKSAALYEQAFVGN